MCTKAEAFAINWMKNMRQHLSFGCQLSGEKRFEPVQMAIYIIEYVLRHSQTNRQLNQFVY